MLRALLIFCLTACILAVGGKVDLLKLRREDKSVVGADGMTREGLGTCDVVVGMGMGNSQCGQAWRGEDVGWRMEERGSEVARTSKAEQR
jgi:hypothetical protein